MTNPKHVQRFTPRRDIFAEAKPATTEVPTPPVKYINYKQKQKKFPLVQQIHPLLIILLIYAIISPLRYDRKKNPRKFAPGFKTNFNSAETIINLLSDVSPYLNLEEQEKIQNIIGIFEAANILNNIRAGTYQNPRFINTMSYTMDAQERKLEIIKALKPYLPASNHEIIEKAIHTYNALNKVSRNLVHFSSKTDENTETQNATNKITELLEIINPLVPSEQKQKLNQIKNIIKMYNAMESSQLWEKWTQQETKKTQTHDSSSEKDVNSNKPKINKYSNNIKNTIEESDSSPKEPEESNEESKKNITDALKSVLNPEQAQAMEIMMKMAQLLSQKSDDKKDD